MRLVLGILAITSGALGGCGDDGAESSDTGRIVVTTTILGDVVRNVVGDDAAVDVVLPAGADPHEFEPSARQVEAMAEADLLVVNGAGFEEGLQSAVDAAAEAGVELFVAAEHVELLELEGGDDPHLWTDPSRIADVVEALGEALDATERAAAYADELRALDAEIEAMIEAIPPERRVLVTNHEVLGYFADRYGFDVIGTVISSPSTGAQASASDIEDLAAVLRGQAVPAVFAESTSSADLAEALAREVGGDVEVVTLFTESLGRPGSGADTYVDMQRTNARLIVEALS